MGFLGIYNLDYCGGIPEFSKATSVNVSTAGNALMVTAGFKSVTIDFSDISGVAIKTDEQISKDVTLTRLLLVGFFAFGMKKKTKNVTNYLTIDYSVAGLSTSAIFTGKDVLKVYSSLLNAIKRIVAQKEAIVPSLAATQDVDTLAAELYLITKGDKMTAIKEMAKVSRLSLVECKSIIDNYFDNAKNGVQPTQNENSSDSCAEIEKFHALFVRGILTQDEFDAKKKSLLNI